MSHNLIKYTMETSISYLFRLKIMCSNKYASEAI